MLIKSAVALVVPYRGRLVCHHNLTPTHRILAIIIFISISFLLNSLNVASLCATESGTKYGNQTPFWLAKWFLIFVKLLSNQVYAMFKIAVAPLKHTRVIAVYYLPSYIFRIALPVIWSRIINFNWWSSDKSTFWYRS